MGKYLVLILALSLMPCAARAEIEKITVNGMVCAFCAVGIEKSFGALSATDKIVVDLDNHLVTVTTKTGQAIDDATIKRIIKEAGFETVGIERMPS